MPHVPEPLRLAHGEISREIIAAYLHVYNALMPRLPEVVYQRSMAIALEMRGLQHEREVPVPVLFEGRLVGEYRADLVVEGRFLVELKAVDQLHAIHEAQVYNYLRISRLPAALLMNFGPKPTYRRLVLPRGGTVR